MLTVSLGGAEPDLADRLDPAGKRAIVDDLVADAVDAADPVERRRARISMQPPAAAAMRRAGSAT